jgi:phenylacetic acid degradation operon negative regulatory protein
VVHTASVNARSALFDLYGDHLRSRGGAAPVAALVRMMGSLDIAAPAVRTAVSRMVRQGWLAPARLDGGPGYRLTPRADVRLTEAAHRIYRTEPQDWDRHWHLLVIDHVPDRAARERIRNGLRYLGYAPLRDGTWVSPRRSDEVDTLLAAEDVRAHGFRAAYDGDATVLATDAWDIAGLGHAYERWLAEAQHIVGGDGARAGDEGDFVTRSRLVHEWRKFLFTDPGLPRDLLPARWPGEEAAAFFDDQAAQLLPGAGRYVDGCLRPNGDA